MILKCKLWLWVIGLLATCQVSLQAFQLVEDGVSRVTIIIPDEASGIVRYAAEELQTFLPAPQGESVQVVKESQSASVSGNRILLGPLFEASELGIETPVEVNGWKIAVNGESLYILGNDGNALPPLQDNSSMGTLLGVYHLLDVYLGIRWVWPGELGTHVPAHENVVLQDSVLIEGKTPLQTSRMRFGGIRKEWREGEEFRSRSILEVNRWMRRQHVVLNKGMDTSGAGHGFYRGPEGRRSYWERFGKEHPEYFAQRADGVRAPVDERVYLVQTCVSNAGLRSQIIKDWLHSRSNGGGQNVGAYEHDRRSIDPFCYCPDCRAWDEPIRKISPYVAWHIDSRDPEILTDLDYTSMSNRYARFYLELQKEAAKHDPDANVVGYAYSTYADPPVGVELNKNIFISLVPSFTYPRSESFQELWDGWKDTGATMYYRPNNFLLGYCVPYINQTQVGEDLLYAFHNGLNGTDFDSLQGMWGVHGPELYVLGRVHNRPDLSLQQMLAEYYSVFGPAADKVREYFDFWESVTKSCDRDFYLRVKGGWASVSRGIDLVFTKYHFEQGKEILNEAAALVAEDSLEAQRVHYLQVWAENADLSVQVMAANRAYRDSGKTEETLQALREARDKLYRFREQNLNYFIGADMGLLDMLEGWSGWREL